MFRFKPRFAVLVVLFVLLGLVGLPAASATPPSESGVVERGETDFWWWDFDEKSGLAAVFNLDLDGYCDPENAPPWDEAPPAGIGMLAEQRLLIPSLADTSDPFTGEPLPFPSFAGKLKGEEVPTMVWAIDETFYDFLDVIFALPPGPESDLPFWEAFCGWFDGDTALAEGYTKLRFTDNDAFADISDNNRSNAWGLVANGNLMGDGMKYRFHATIKMVWSGDIFDDRFHGVYKIELH